MFLERIGRIMDEKTRQFVMRIIALTAVFTFIYPAAMILRTLIFGDEGGYTYLLAGAGYTILGFAGGLMAASEKKTLFLPVLGNIYIAYFLMLIPALLIIITHIGTGVWRALFEEALLPALFIPALRTASRPMGAVLTRNRIYTGAVMLLASLLTTRYVESLLYLLIRAAVFACVFIILSMIFKNQEALDDSLLSRRNEDIASLPKKIRRFNIVSILMVIAGAFLLFFLRDIVIYLFAVSGRVLGFLIILFMKLLALLMPAGEEGGAQHEQGQMPELPKDESTGNPILDLIFKIVFIILAGYILYKALPVVLRKLRSLVLKLIEMVKKLFVPESKETQKQVDEYSDEVEILNASKKPENKHSRGKKARRDLKGLKKISNPVEKIRYMYGLILDMLNSEKQLVKHGDTPREICIKSREIIERSESAECIKSMECTDSIECMESLTHSYETVRYGDRMPDTGELLKAEENFKKLHY
jgi:hypothetical protein